MSIQPLPANLPGNDSAADRAIALKVNEVVGVVNTQDTKTAAIEARLAKLEAAGATIETRLTALEQVDTQGGTEPPPPPVPVASISVTVTPTAVNVGQTAATTVTLKDLAGNVLTGRAVTITTSPTTVATVDANGVLTGKAAGTATVTATSEGKTGIASLAVTVAQPEPQPAPGAVAALPTSEPTRTAPAGTGAGTVRRVAAGGDLQAALNAAMPGDTVLLAVGSTFTGNYTLPARKVGTGWITLRTEVAASTGRMTPTRAATLKLAKLVTPNNQPVLRTVSLDPPTSGWLIQDLEVTGTLGITSLQYGLIWLGDGGWAGGGETQNSLTRVPSGFVVERLYLHGNDQLNCVRGINLNSAQTAIVDCWISEIHSNSSDAQAICGWNGPGPYLIENNHIAGSTENILFGGADPGIIGLIPADITIRRNHVFKPLGWKGSATTTQWKVKNLFELKNAQRVLVEANVFENNWAHAQSGMAIVIKSQTGNEIGQLLGQGSTDITFRSNIIDTTHRGLNLQAVGEGGSDRHVARVVVENNLFRNVGAANGVPPTDGWLILLTHDLRDIRIRHNTFLGNAPGYGLAAYLDPAGMRATNIDISDNVLAGLSYYALGSSVGQLHASALTAYAGTAWTFKGNAVSQIDGQFQAQYPAGNLLVDQVGKLGLAADGSLAATSPAKAKATDGTDPGANVGEVLRRTSGVVVAP